MRAITLCLLTAILLGCSGSPGRRSAVTAKGGAPVRAPGYHRNPSYRLEDLKVLRQGKYRAKVAGVLCNACTRAIVENLKALAAIKRAKFDFEEGVLWITVAKGKSIRATKIERAVRHASRRVELGTTYEITEIRFAK